MAQAGGVRRATSRLVWRVMVTGYRRRQQRKRRSSTVQWYV